MVAAALVMGSPVLFKPAEQSPACGSALAELLLEAGVEPAALAFCPATVKLGRWLVAEPRVATIAFTGSVAVGLEIQRRAHAADGQLQIKRIVAELGGKNCVLVDSDVDLDEAVPAIVRSAYGWTSQKCSAAARASSTRQSPTVWSLEWPGRSSSCASARPRTSPPRFPP